MQVRTFIEMDIPFPAVSEGEIFEGWDTGIFEGFSGVAMSETLETFRFTYPDETVPFDSIPSLDGLSITPSVVDPGQSIGLRATVNVSIKDFQYPINGTSYFNGTFFGKLRAIKPSLQGVNLRVIRGEHGQTLAEMVTEHYVIESLSRNAKSVKIVAKDILKLTDGDRSQAPAISNGRLLTSISESDVTATLTPTGIGDIEYPASGKVSLGGAEVCLFTRSGDVLTLTRAQSGTEADEHDEDEIVQLVLIYTSESPADLVYDLLTSYTQVDAAWCPLTEWKDDIDSYIGRLYSAEIAEPTSVKTLINEIILQAGLVMWWDEIGQNVRLKSLRPVTGDRTIDVSEIVDRTFKFTEQPSKRRSQTWTYFALKNPLERLDEVKNFRSGLVSIDTASDATYGQSAICKTFCRWIQINNRPAASRLNAQLISRYKDPPRKFSFDLLRNSDEITKGQGIFVRHPSLQNDVGALVDIPVQIIAVEKQEGKYSVQCEEMNFGEFTDPNDPDTAGSRLIIIDSNILDMNLRTLHDSIYTPPSEYDEILCIIEAGIFVGSTNFSIPAFDVGSWPDAVEITVKIAGRIQGAGGKGAINGLVAGKSGGTALYSRYPITVENTGEIHGGGGGGGGAGDFHTGIPLPGGGGAGFEPGESGGAAAQPGTTEIGGFGASGSGGSGGSGGGKAQPGQSGSGSPGFFSGGGAAGAAIDGVSFISFTESGTINGSQIN